jgi:FkbM family methyltransferase
VRLNGKSRPLVLTTALKSSVKRALKRLGMEVRRVDARAGSSARLSTPGLLEHLAASHPEIASVIDVGAAYGDFAIECRPLFPNAQCLLVEPLEEYGSHLQRALATIGNAELVIAALGAHDGETTLNVHADWVGSSTYVEAEEPGVNGTPRTVRMATLDGLIAQRDLPGPYLLKIDVQGAELDVLAGASVTLSKAAYVLLEVSFFRFFGNGPQLGEVVAFMHARGFVAYDLANPHYRPMDGALAQVDLAFVPDASPLRARHAYATAEQRARLNRVGPRAVGAR